MDDIEWWIPKWREGEPCSHPGCLSHISHPCEGCGRIGGEYEREYLQQLRNRNPNEYKRLIEGNFDDLTGGDDETE